jgi:hypothetical protein
VGCKRLATLNQQKQDARLVTIKLTAKIAKDAKVREETILPKKMKKKASNIRATPSLHCFQGKALKYASLDPDLTFLSKNNRFAKLRDLRDLRGLYLWKCKEKVFSAK